RAILDDPDNYPILIHCFAGIHRTGAYVAIYHMERDRWSNEDAIADLKAGGYDNLDNELDVLGYLQQYRPTWQQSEEPPAAAPAVVFILVLLLAAPAAPAAAALVLGAAEAEDRPEDEAEEGQADAEAGPLAELVGDLDHQQDQEHDVGTRHAQDEEEPRRRLLGDLHHHPHVVVGDDGGPARLAGLLERL